MYDFFVCVLSVVINMKRKTILQNILQKHKLSHIKCNKCDFYIVVKKISNSRFAMSLHGNCRIQFYGIKQVQHLN